MQAAWYETQAAARKVLVLGSMPDPHTRPGDVRIRIAASGINPGDLKKREGSNQRPLRVKATLNKSTHPGAAAL